MQDPSATFQHEPDLVDILWRQDVDLGVEREIFDGCLRQRTEEARRAREREQKSKRELERIMQRLQKLDKETGEVLPAPAPVNCQTMPLPVALVPAVSTQHSPITQNPLLTALLFKSQKAPSEEQALGEARSVPDLQYYLDLLESESPNLPLEDIIEICINNPSHKRSSTDALCDFGELTQTVSDSIDVAEPLLCSPCNPVRETCLPTFPDSATESVCSPLNTMYNSSATENLNEMSLTKRQLNSSQSAEFGLELTSTYTINTSTLSQLEQSSGLPEWDTSHALSCVADSPVLIGFDDSASAESVDMDTSLYATDSIKGQSEEEELESIQSNYIDLLSMSLDSEAVEELYETVKGQTQNDSSEPLPNHTTTRGRPRMGRDEQQARALGLPLSVHDIISLPVEAFNEVVSSSKLSHAQLSLIRDIRRRGKNKMAAQSCRKRKLDSLVDLEEEVKALKKQKEQRIKEQERNTRDLQDTKERLKKLYNEVFRQLRDEHGNPYNPNTYKLQLSTDGTVYLLPRSTDNKKNTLTEDSPVAV